MSLDSVDPTAGRVPRLFLRWESMWRHVMPHAPNDQASLANREGALVQAGYVMYSDARDLVEFDAAVIPLLTKLREAHPGLMLGIVAEPDTLLGSRFLRLMERCHELNVRTVVEIRGHWTLPMLELFVAGRPTFLRVGPDLTSGISMVPEQFRAVVALADYLRNTGVPLVARGVTAPGDLDALRVAGVELVHRGESMLELDDALFGDAMNPLPSLRMRDQP